MRGDVSYDLAVSAGDFGVGAEISRIGKGVGEFAEAFEEV